jgi:hypothetical protein
LGGAVNSQLRQVNVLCRHEYPVTKPGNWAFFKQSTTW